MFLVAFAWLELIEVTTYLNHYWFVTLLGLVLLALPAACVLVARRARGRGRAADGAARRDRGSCARRWRVVYVFAGLAKLNADWLLHGLPLRMWLPAHADLAIVGPWLDEPWVAIALSWAGARVRLPHRARAAAGSGRGRSRGARSSCSTSSRGGCSRSACSRG